MIITLCFTVSLYLKYNDFTSQVYTSSYKILNNSVNLLEDKLSYYYILASCCTVLFNGFCRLCCHLHAALL
jgi:hypothetical protein